MRESGDSFRVLGGMERLGDLKTDTISHKLLSH